MKVSVTILGGSAHRRIMSERKGGGHSQHTSFQNDCPHVRDYKTNSTHGTPISAIAMQAHWYVLGAVLEHTKGCLTCSIEQLSWQE
eukprot:3618310-Amphidinium_carterae.1